METTETALLRAAANRAGRRPGFLAYDLTSYQAVTGEEPAARLGVTGEELDRLALCRMPRRGTHFGHDILAIAAHVGVEPVALADLLRRRDVLTQLQAACSRLEEDENVSRSAMLTAARDETDEHTVLSDIPVASGGLPGWLHEAVDRFWQTAPAATRFPRDLDFAVLVGLPLAVVELPRPSVRAIGEWLTVHKIDLGISGDDRQLRACLVALGGVGLVFVDADDDLTQRRVSLAHEAAHFIVEYLLPRQEVARRRPELLEVIDGQRAATTRERLSSVISDVPIGLHTHLLDPGTHHYTRHERVEAAEWRARRVALELLAPQNIVLDKMAMAGVKDRDAVQALLVSVFGLPLSLAEDYAEQLIAVSRPPRMGVLDLLSRPARDDETGSPA